MVDLLLNPALIIPLFMLSQLADIWTTNFALVSGARELNPVIARLMDWLGELWFLPKLALAGGVAWYLWSIGSAVWLWLPTAIFFAVAVHNYRGAR